MAQQKSSANRKQQNDDSQLPAEQQEGGVPAVDYGDFAGAGFEDHSKDDYALPFFGVLQALSPQIENMDEAKPGMIINTVTEELFSGNEGIRFIPCHTQHVYVEWTPRDQGGGLVAVHELNSDAVTWAKENCKFGEYKSPDGNDLVETFYVYGIMLRDDGTAEQGVLAFSSTKIKKYKQWMTKARTVQVKNGQGRRVTPPLFAHVYRLTTEKQKNNKGEFYNWNITWDGSSASDCRLSPEDPLFEEAAGLAGMVKSGAAKADHESQAATGGGGEDNGEEMPF